MPIKIQAFLTTMSPLLHGPTEMFKYIIWHPYLYRCFSCLFLSASIQPAMGSIEKKTVLQMVVVVGTSTLRM